MSGWRFWRRLRDQEQELDEELRAHLAIEARQRVERGEDPDEAAFAARRVFGNPGVIREQTREIWGWADVERFFDDVRHGLRMLMKTPGWTAVMAATLALGIGLATAIFSVVYGVLLQPLPYPEPERLMALWSTAPERGMPRLNVGAANWMDWRAEAQSFADIAITRPVANFNLTGAGAPERLQGARTSWNVPAVLGVKPLLGRVFTEEEQKRDARVAVLSYGLWQRRFGRDAGLPGRTIQLNGEAFEVIGVMPPDYRYPTRDFELWTPLYVRPEEVQQRMGYDYIAVGRLKPQVRVEQAQAELSTIMERLGERYPEINRVFGAKVGVLVEPLMERGVGQVRQTLYILLATVGCLLAIGCVNLGNLLLARGSARAREMAVRAALGASGGRLRRQILAELLPLSIGGAAGGLLLGAWLLQAMLPFLPPQMPRVEAIGLHWPVVAAAIGLSIVVILAAGMLPARLAARVNLSESLKLDSRTVAGGGGVRDLLVVGQVAVTLALVFGGGLLVRSLQAVLQVSPGFRTEGVLTMHLAVTRAKYPGDPQVAAYCRRMLERVASVPGVSAAGMVNRLPLSGTEQTMSLEFEGHDGPFMVDSRSATPGYFQAMGIALVRGRSLVESDKEGAPPVGLVDERVVRQVFGTDDPLGKRFRFAGGMGPWTTIVGVVGHIRNQNLEEDLRPQVYWPYAQRTQDRMVLVVRTLGRPEPFTAAVVEQIHKEDADQPVYDVRSMEEWLDRSLQQRHLLTGMVSVFGAASLILACLGLYGVVSYAAGLRLREFGIRMALGANPGTVRSLVLRHAARLAFLGSLAGCLLAWPVGMVLRTVLYGVGLSDPVILVVALVLLLAVALVAGWGPARRAGRVDPWVVLRGD